jgi:hypothetical protein
MERKPLSTSRYLHETVRKFGTLQDPETYRYAYVKH